MKKIILLALTALMMVGCRKVSVEKVHIKEGERIISVDSCEYIERGVYYGTVLVHKGNCRFCMGICAGKEYINMLTGTPVVNDTMDLANQLCILGRIEDFGGYRNFVNTYGDGKHLSELNAILHSSCYFRRGKKEVLKDLPDLTRSKVFTEQIVVFAEHHDIVDSLVEAIPDAVCVTGRQNAVQKQAAIDAFQAGERRVIICSIKAAGVGLTLTASSNVLFINLPWTMADLSQCEARCHRNGQKNAVNSWILIGNRGELDTIDSYLYHLIMKKGSMANKITGAVDDALKDERYFEELADLFINGIKDDRIR